MPPKQNLTIRISDEDRALLELIAAREMRSVSNQTIWLLHIGIKRYLEDEMLHYNPQEGKLENILDTMPGHHSVSDPPEP
jgi:hypothetical protein